MAELQLRYYGDIFKARKGFFKGLELRPDDAYCHYNLGFIHHLLGVFDKSCAHYEKAIINHQIANKAAEVRKNGRENNQRKG